MALKTSHDANTAVCSRVSDATHYRIEDRSDLFGEVFGRRIEFTIRARDGDEEIGVGTHERMVIDLTKFSERVKRKFA